ncbi:hypothetical protein Acr_11g0010070 [Actinidia rufa]|uniref:Uncharacterized protein n=1 Tax=Actinidia rufa TaxID=165716 RepID=A0A7J0FDE1_9ERIC|nr:hypothetical protein Acr_11g0010070 [Actinidia rufa]
MFSGVDNLRCTYDFHYAFFSLSLVDLSLEAFYGSICEEIDLSQPISSNITEMKKQSKELPSLSEVFSRLRQATLPHVASSPAERFALAASVGPYCPLGIRSDYSQGGRTYGRGRCDSSSGGRNRRRGSWRCTHYN